MKTELIIMNIMAEVARAETIHPAWPRDPVKAASLCAEGCGGLVRTANIYDEKRGTKREMIVEAVRTATAAIRFLKGTELDNEADKRFILSNQGENHE